MKVDSKQQQVLAGLCHGINSPLAAIRNALYLCACRSNDSDLLQYLRLANEEITAITRILHEARSLLGDIPAELAMPANRQRRSRSRSVAA